MNKKYYIEANNDIKASENLKRKVINEAKILKKENKNHNLVLKLAGSIAIFLFVFSVALFNKEKVINILPQTVSTKLNLPTVDNFDTMYEILSVKYDNTTKGDVILEDTIESSVSTPGISSSAANLEAIEEKEVTDYSKTNTQIEGVDEADIVKTDGKNIYYLSDERLVIVDATNPENMSIKQKIIFDERIEPIELYVTENKVIAIANKTKKYDETSKSYKRLFNYNMTIAIVYDLENDKFEKTREIEIEGYYNSSRMIGNNIYIVANDTKILYNIGKSEIDEEDLKPTYRDTAISEEYKKIDYNEIYYFENDVTRCLLTIGSFNVNENNEVNVETFIGSGDTIYCSQNNLYIVRTEYDYSSYNGYQNYTQIYKFKLNGEKIEFVAQQEVKGNVLNQFSMDEYDGYFRIVTTEYDSSYETSNNIYILDDKLNKISKIGNLAEEEKVYSVRFMRKKAYVVTYRETDPLFVIDLSDVKSPKVLGELKIPGYSDYLHPYDENHIIGFGEETEEVKTNYGTTVKTTGMKMALFDVTDPTNPKELFSVKIGDDGTYSELLDNHKALLFSKEKNIIAFPISIRKYNSKYYYKNTFQGAIIYSLDLENGFKEEAKISHMISKDETYRYSSYSISDNSVERIIYIGNTLFTLSQDEIKATDLTSFKEIGSINLDTGYEVTVY